MGRVMILNSGEFNWCLLIWPKNRSVYLSRCFYIGRVPKSAALEVFLGRCWICLRVLILVQLQFCDMALWQDESFESERHPRENIGEGIDAIGPVETCTIEGDTCVDACFKPGFN